MKNLKLIIFMILITLINTFLDYSIKNGAYSLFEWDNVRLRDMISSFLVSALISSIIAFMILKYGRKIFNYK